jgi:DNA-binding NtrC family response regulator
VKEHFLTLREFFEKLADKLQSGTMPNLGGVARLLQSAAQCIWPAPGEVDSETLQHAILGESQPLRDVTSEIGILARHKVPVFLQGERGVGKEGIARLIHAKSGRLGLFIPLNCAAIPAHLLEGELFGLGPDHGVEGAPSGKARQGKFEQADGGTLFLDEIAELLPTHQSKLLRAVEYGTIEKIGAQTVTVDVRIISATRKKVGEFPFDESLADRLKMNSPLRVPRLHDRGDDVIKIVETLITNAEMAHQKLGVDRVVLMMVRDYELESQTRESLLAHLWPGNVRELLECLGNAIIRGYLSEDTFNEQLRKEIGAREAQGACEALPTGSSGVSTDSAPAAPAARSIPSPVAAAGSPLSSYVVLLGQGKPVGVAETLLKCAFPRGEGLATTDQERAIGRLVEVATQAKAYLTKTFTAPWAGSVVGNLAAGLVEGGRCEQEAKYIAKEVSYRAGLGLASPVWTKPAEKAYAKASTSNSPSSTSGS